MSNTSCPDYISVNEDDEGAITATVRGEGITVQLPLPPSACRTLALALARIPV